MLRILHLDTGREMRGGQWQVLQLVQGLAARGHRVRLLARGPLLDMAIESGIEAGVISLLGVAAAAAAGFDIVHAHDAKSHTWASPFGRRRLVVSRRVIFPLKTGALSVWKYEQASRYIAISKAVAAQLTAAGVPDDRIDVVYDGVSIPESVIPYESRPASRFLCLAKEMPAPTGVELQFPVRLADEVPEARGFVYLSKSEGLGSAALLAMAHAVPVIASRIGGLPEAIGEAGILIDSESEVAAAVARLKAGPGLAKAIGMAGRERAMRLFSVDTMVDGTLRTYERVIAKSK